MLHFATMMSKYYVIIVVTGTQLLTGVLSVTNANKGSIIPALMTKSLHSEPSPVILPKAQTACSHTLT